MFPDYELGNVKNSGYILLDGSQSESINLIFKEDMSNDVEIVIYSQDLFVASDAIENNGTMTFWAEGTEIPYILLNNYTNIGNTCFRNQKVRITEAIGDGCFAISGSEILFKGKYHDNFNPTIVFEGKYNSLTLEGEVPISTFRLINFGNQSSITIPNYGYKRYEYSNGNLIIYMGTNKTKFNIGDGYDPMNLKVRVGSSIEINYIDSAPTGANNDSICSCSLNIRSADQEFAVSSETIDTESSTKPFHACGPGNEKRDTDCGNDSVSSSSVSKPIYSFLISLIVLVMFM